MNHLDFLSSSPGIYLLKEKRGKNKLGGFFSIIFALLILASSIYYFYIYFSCLDYHIIYYRNNMITYMDQDQEEYLNKPKLFYFSIFNNTNNAKIIPMIIDFNGTERQAEKCESNINPGILTNETYCFNLSFNYLNLGSKENNKTFILYCEENCIDKNGNPAKIDFELITKNLITTHSNKIPFDTMRNNLTIFTGIKTHLIIRKNKSVNIRFKFTPIIYESSEILNTQKKIYINNYFANYEQYEFSRGDNAFALFDIDLTCDCDIYIREYKTLLETISKIGGLFTLFKLIFEVLIMFYSDSENNSEITKNVFSKIKNYEYKHINEFQKANINNNLDIKINNENKILRKNFKINKVKQYFCSFINCCYSSCNCCKTKRTMKILNQCSDFVQTYLSAENIIFNMILFENYYKSNPIKYNKNPFLDNIEKDIEDKDIIKEKENENEENKEKQENEKLVSINDDN